MSPRVAKYFAVAEAAARRALAERSGVVGRVVFLGVVLFVFSRIWAVLGARGALAHAQQGDLVWYLGVTEWCVLSLPPVYLAIEADVRSGDVACRLVRPISYVGAQLADALGETALRLAVLGPASALFAFMIAGGGPSDPRGLALALPLGLLASALAAASLVAIGLSAFWVVDTSPVFWIWQKLLFVLGGLLLPLDLYPDWLRVAARFSPFPAMVFGPGRNALAFAPAEAVVTALELVAWSGVVAALLVWLSSRARARLTVNGG
jgi:ABC-2 type transport system permease protein